MPSHIHRQDLPERSDLGRVTTSAHTCCGVRALSVGHGSRASQDKVKSLEHDPELQEMFEDASLRLCEMFRPRSAREPVSHRMSVRSQWCRAWFGLRECTGSEARGVSDMRSLRPSHVPVLVWYE